MWTGSSGVKRTQYLARYDTLKLSTLVECFDDFTASPGG